MDGTPRPTLPVTVVIPAYNRADMVGRAIRSVTAQRGFVPAEVLCVDDASTDGTAAAAEAAGATVLRHETNQGAATARNTALATASQPWIALLDSDDEWLPGHLETLWPARADHILVSGTALALDADGTVRLNGRLVPWPQLLLSPRPLLWTNTVSASGALLRADVARAVGGFDTTLRFAEDLDLWIRMLARGTGVVLDTPVCVWHRHADQKSGSAVPSFAAHRAMLRRYEAEPWWSGRWFERRVGVQEWDTFRARLRGGPPRAALRGLLPVLGHPQQLLGVVGELVARVVARRRGPVVATRYLPGPPRS